MLSALIIEDEKSSQKLLKKILSDYCPKVLLKGIAATKMDSINQIQQNEPDIVFMDISLQDCNAFEILEMVDSSLFKIIFTTAHEEYAIKAFKYEAVDYLLKPFAPKDVIEALAKVKKQKISDEKLSDLRHAIFPSLKARKLPKISVSTSEGIYLIPVDDIIYVEADGSYSNVYLKDGSKKIVSKNLKEFEKSLHPDSFFRPHTSYVINLDNIEAYIKEDGGYLLMKNNSKVPVARRKKAALLNLIAP